MTRKEFAMTRFTIALAALAAALLVPAAALAKGPSAASISGPGLGKTLRISGNGENESSALGRLTADTGFFPSAFGQEPNPLLPGRPHGKLGPKFTIRYLVPGGDGRRVFHITQDLYPYAAGGAVTYMKPGQKIFDFTTTGGWFRGDVELKQTLVRHGLPARAPKTSSSNRNLAVLVGAPIVLLLAGTGAFLARRRRSR
jgi:LPXTG-motif cell wall-anchored protein